MFSPSVRGLLFCILANMVHYHFLHILKQNEEYFKLHMLKIICTLTSHLLNSWISPVRLLLPYWFLQLYIMDINALFYSANSFCCLLTLTNVNILICNLWISHISVLLIFPSVDSEFYILFQRSYKKSLFPQCLLSLF